jgi:dipeptidyl aminopeptidase/acylaminoacyl peptidase
MVEHLGVSRDGASLVYSANTGTTQDDDDRRHLYRVAVDGGAPVALTHGQGLEWSPTALSSGVAFIAATVQTPPATAVLTGTDAAPRVLEGQTPPEDFAGARFVTPRQVAFKAPDGLVIHGQLFEAAGGQARKPGVIFVHGGPPRQMMLGWSYMDYYSNAYALNQYLAAHGFTVLSVNYRLGIGYGWDFQHPDKGGPAGSSEYQDVLAGARWLQTQPEVDPARIGIWGGSYGGLLTALALARNSEVFKAGVDFHGVHDWSREPFFWQDETGHVWSRYEQGDRAEAAAVAFRASPIADVATWRSPVLLIQGDDDRNVQFHQTVDLARRLQAKRDVHVEELVIPDEIHGFLRWESWRKADAAAAEFLSRELDAGSGK